MRNCMVGNDTNTELCEKVRHIYKVVLSFWGNVSRIGFFNSNGDNDD